MGHVSLKLSHLETRTEITATFEMLKDQRVEMFTNTFAYPSISPSLSVWYIYNGYIVTDSTYQDRSVYRSIKRSEKSLEKRYSCIYNMHYISHFLLVISHNDKRAGGPPLFNHERIHFIIGYRPLPSFSLTYLMAVIYCLWMCLAGGTCPG